MKKLTLLILALATTASLQANDPFFDDPFGDNIFKEMMQMQRNMDRMFERMHERMNQRTLRLRDHIGSFRLATRTQMVNTGDGYEFKTDIPQSKENNIKINVDNHLLTLRAKIIKTQQGNSGGVASSQRYVSMYQNSLTIPQDADESSMKSEYRNGVLVITFKKKDKSKDPNSSKSTTAPQEPIRVKEPPRHLDINTSNKKPIDSHQSSLG